MVKSSFFSKVLVLGAFLVVAASSQEVPLISSATAQPMPSQAQIEQLRSLPRAQQEQLARQFGIDIQMLDQLDRRNSQPSAEQEETVVFPRGTEFDEYGDPVMPADLAKQFTRDDKELKPFGYDLFAGQPRSFNPTSHAPVPNNYIIGIGDNIQVQLFGQEDRSHDLVVDREGKIVIPRIGELNVAGITYAAMQELIKHNVRQRLIGYNAAVSMGELRSIQIYVVGEAYQPGAYTVSSLATLSQALYVAGGVSDIASLRSVQLMRGGQLESELDLYDLLMRGNARSDLMLRSGDVIFIPPRGQMVAVEGEVNRPALYELKGDETLQDALRFAGGTTSDAYLSSTRIRRVQDGRRQITTFDLTDDATLQEPLMGGDHITIGTISDDLSESILLIGAATHPGYYQWHEGIRINDIIRDSRRDLLEQTDLSYGLIVRERSTRRDIEVYQFDVALAVDGDEAENFELHERDQILLFSRYQTRDEEEQNLSRMIMTQDERDQERRQELLRDYRQAYLENLVSEELGLDRDEEDSRLMRDAPLSEIFGTPDEDDQEIDPKDLAEFSRDRLLEPLMRRLQRQRTGEGNTPFVYVAGEVNHPGVYPLVKNVTVSKLIAAAGGLKDSAYLERAEVTRLNLNEGDARTDYFTVNLLDVMLGTDDISLRGRDRLNILSIPEWQNTYEVTLRGEVRFPGTYSIRRGESLTALIERAGGFTDFAFIEGTVFTREELRRQERQRINMLAEELQREIASNAITGTGGSTQSYEQMRTLLGDLMGIEPVGRLIIDLPRIIAGQSHVDDIQLKDGDTLHVPSRQDAISIIGEVQMATSYRFDRELTVSDYINMSGGTKRKADSDRIYVVRANGAIEPYRQRRGWFSHSGAVNLRPGDTIVVPLDTTYTESLQFWGQVTTIIYNSAIALAAINSI